MGAERRSLYLMSSGIGDMEMRCLPARLRRRIFVNVSSVPHYYNKSIPGSHQLALTSFHKPQHALSHPSYKFSTLSTPVSSTLLLVSTIGETTRTMQADQMPVL